MVAAKKAATIGHLDAAAFEDLRVRFNAMHAWAVEHFSEAQLLAAVRTFRACDYKPPLPEEFDRTRRAEPIPSKPSPEAERIARAKQLVDEIRDRALALGWTMESLYFCEGYERRPFAARYGVVVLHRRRAPDWRGHPPVHRAYRAAANGDALAIL